MLNYLFTTMVTPYPRPIYTDMIMAVVDTLSFLLMAVVLQWQALPLRGTVYQAAWGVVAIGTLWQAVVSLARATHYYLPDLVWSGWALQDIGLFAVVIVLFMNARKRRRGQ